MAFLIRAILSVLIRWQRVDKPDAGRRKGRRVGIALLGPMVCASMGFAGCMRDRFAHPAPAATALRRFEFTQPQMGVPFRLVFYAPKEPVAAAAARAAFARIEQLNGVLSDYDPDSELSRLAQTSGTDRAVPLSDDLWRVLVRSQELAGRTGGAFDVTVGPVVNLWRRARRQRKLPEAQALADAQCRVGFQKLQLDRTRRTAKLLTPDMRLDLGGIAKGYALDEALRTLRAAGIQRALVTGGGDMVAGDPPPGAKGWRIELAAFDASNAPPARFVSLARAALATSGDVFQRLEIDGRRYSHIVDPRTGLGLTDHSLVTVIARDGMTADSLATAISVLGPDQGLRVARQFPGVEVRVIRQPQDAIEVRASRRFQRWIEF